MFLFESVIWINAGNCCGSTVCQAGYLDQSWISWFIVIVTIIIIIIITAINWCRIIPISINHQPLVDTIIIWSTVFHRDSPQLFCTSWWSAPSLISAKEREQCCLRLSSIVSHGLQKQRTISKSGVEESSFWVKVTFKEINMRQHLIGAQENDSPIAWFSDHNQLSNKHLWCAPIIDPLSVARQRPIRSGFREKSTVHRF